MNTHIVVLLDQSGSMEGIKQDTIGSYNQYLNEQRSAALAGDTWSLTLFDTKVEPRFTMFPVQDVPPLTPETFRPNGFTALLDAIQDTVDVTAKRLPTGDRVLFVIITDGHENASRHASQATVKALISAKEASGDWTFVYLGANVDAFGEAASLGIQSGNALNYAASSAGVSTAYATLNASTMLYRAAPRGARLSLFVDPNDQQP